MLQVFDGPPQHWLYGNIRDVPRNDSLDVTLELFEKYGPAFKFFMGPFKPEVVLGGHEYIQAVMNTSEPKDNFYALFQPWLGNGLLISSGKKWARNRKLLTPAFHFEILKPYQRLFSESTMVLVSKWRNMMQEKPDESVEMFEHISLLTLDSLMKCIFSTESNVQEGNKVYKVTELMVDRFRFFPYHNEWIFFFSYMGYKMRTAVNAITTFPCLSSRRKRDKS